MKKDIHPTWYPDAQVTCSCGATYTMGATKETIRTDVCAACHPFFTGKQKLVDTAGRLHTKVNLMEELKKIKRSLSKKSADAPHETLLVLDATTGQNALSQARLFDEAIDLSALALTKLDGTAKGGIVVSICSTLNIPLKYVGVGEQIDDLQDFDPRQFVDALF